MLAQIKAYPEHRFLFSTMSAQINPAHAHLEGEPSGQVAQVLTPKGALLPLPLTAERKAKPQKKIPGRRIVLRGVM